VLAGRSQAWAGLVAADWEALVELALRHDLAPWLHARLRQHRAAPPPAAASRLHEAYLASAAHSLRVLHQLGEILGAFRAAGIPVIPLKGACLAEAVYGDSALRPMADLDVLVKPGDLDQAVRKLRALGYTSGQPFDPAAARTGFQDMPEMSRPAGVPVELHWTLVTPLSGVNVDAGELEGLWSRAHSATIACVETLTLSPADLLLHLCLHMSVHHRFNHISLRNVVDLAEVCRRYSSDIGWAELVTRANAWGGANGVRIALELALEWTDLAVPPRALAGLAGDAAGDTTIAWVKRKVVRGSPPALNGQMHRLEAEGRLAGRLGAARDALFLPRGVMARLYPAPADSWRLLTYYPVRWTDLWVRYRAALWKLVTRNRQFVEEARNEAQLREYLGWR
jgi:hypothetical protein